MATAGSAGGADAKMDTKDKIDKKDKVDEDALYDVPKESELRSCYLRHLKDCYLGEKTARAVASDDFLYFAGGWRIGFAVEQRVQLAAAVFQDYCCRDATTSRGRSLCVSAKLSHNRHQQDIRQAILACIKRVKMNVESGNK